MHLLALGHQLSSPKQPVALNHAGLFFELGMVFTPLDPKIRLAFSCFLGWQLCKLGKMCMNCVTSTVQLSI